MKYSEEERYKVIHRGLNIQAKTVKKRKSLREKYPVEVEIKDGFYIIESKLNTL